LEILFDSRIIYQDVASLIEKIFPPIGPNQPRPLMTQNGRDPFDALRFLNQMSRPFFREQEEHFCWPHVALNEQHEESGEQKRFVTTRLS
jgi:hypothetical protein